jgi:hypothetical protein
LRDENQRPVSTPRAIGLTCDIPVKTEKAGELDSENWWLCQENCGDSRERPNHYDVTVVDELAGKTD